MHPCRSLHERVYAACAAELEPLQSSEDARLRAAGNRALARIDGVFDGWTARNSVIIDAAVGGFCGAILGVAYVVVACRFSDRAAMWLLGPLPNARR
jgi:hypothetical protein